MTHFEGRGIQVYKFARIEIESKIGIGVFLLWASAINCYQHIVASACGKFIYTTNRGLIVLLPFFVGGSMRTNPDW